MSYAVPSLKPIRDQIAAAVPPGTRASFAMDAAPAGYLIEDGSAVSRAEYADLFAAIGTTWGAGDGSTTFNLPNAENEFERGASASRSVGTVEADEMRAHNHSAGMSGNGSNASNGNGGLLGSENIYRTSQSVNRLFADEMIGDTGGDETRPRCITVLKCIKF